MRTSMLRAAAGVAAVVLLVLTAGAPATASGARRRVDVEAVADALGHDPVYVDPASSLRLDAAQLAQLRADVAASPDRLAVVALGRIPDDVTTTEVAAEVVAKAPDVDWLVVYADGTLPAFGGSYADDDRKTDYLEALGVVDGDQGTPAQRLLAITGRLSGRLDTPNPFDLSPDDPSSPTSTRTAVVRWVAVGIGVLLLLVLVATVAGLAGRRGASGWRTLRLTRSVSRGRRGDLTIQARRDVLDLGSRLDETEMAPGDDADAWQAALDAYDHAGRLLDRAEGTDDLARVVALCREGTAQLDRARRTPSRDA